MEAESISTLLITHPACQEHDPGRPHPDSQERLPAVLNALKGEKFSALVRRSAPKAAIAQIARVHTQPHIDRIFDAVPSSGRRRVDPDTLVCPASGEAALRGVGAVIDAVEQVVAGRARNAFCAVRPPGHHAEPAKAMGFCLFNNIAIGAAHARVALDLERVAVVDFDVHHGNGTQVMLQDHRHFFFASSHQLPLFPGTGHAVETGVDGNVVNVPLPPFTGSVPFRRAYTEHILPALRAFKPDLVMVSAGFDGHAADPLAQFMLSGHDIAWVTRELDAVATDCCGGRLVSVLEGGYDVGALAECSAAHVAALMGN